jgi:quercetin dioxygenase-like cupin family protein
MDVAAHDRLNHEETTMKIFASILILAVGGSVTPGHAADVTPLISKALTDTPGKEAVMITVDYPPGYEGAIHRHNAHSFIYVLEGSVVMQVRGGEQVTVNAGQSFYEAPADVHVVGRNASKSKTARLVVFLIKDSGTPIVIPAE